MSWTETLSASFGSNEEAARKLHAAWRKKDAKAAAKVKEPSLAAKIGQLKRGDVKWWKGRPELLKIFAQLLDVSEQELLGEKVEDESASTIPFPEFPALQPLGMNEEPCSFGKHGWLVHQVLQEKGSSHRWILAPAGSGKTLALAYLAHHGFDGLVMIVRSLEEAVATADPRRVLVVEVTEANPSTDRAALVALARRRSATIVLASFEPPIPGLQWMYTGMQPSPVTRHAGWSVVRANPPEGWRDRLLRWIDVRLEQADGDTKLLADQVQQWLERNDPDQQIVRTPGDLLALCDDVHHHGIDGASLSEMSSRWLVRAVSTLATTSDAMSEWMQRAGVETVRAMVMGYVLDIDRPLSGLDAVAWEKQIPDRVRPPRAEGAPPGDALVIAQLIEGGLLRSTESGALHVFPRWVRGGLIRSTLGAYLEKERSSAWGALAADESRQAAVDDALDALSVPAFRALVRGVVRDFPEPPTLAAVAAVQATFSAAARRLLDDDFKLRDVDVPHWQRLADLQVRFLVDDPNWHELPLPFTRPDDAKWVADAWAFSLRVPCPLGWSHPELDWELPGWSTGLTFRTMPSKSYRWIWFGSVDGEPSSADRKIARLAVEVLERCEDADLPEALPAAFVFAALELSPRRGWRLTAKHLSAFRHAAARQQALANVLRAMPDGHRTEQIIHLWRVLIKPKEPSDMTVAMQVLSRDFEMLIPILVEHVPAAVFEETIRFRGFSVTAGEEDLRMLGILPLRLRAPAIRGWASPAHGKKPSFGEARQLFRALSAADVDVVLEILHGREANFVAELAPLVWKHDVERAREEAAAALRSASPSAAGWYWSAPPAEYLYLIGLIEEGTSIPDWARTWARRRMLNAGRASENMFVLAWGIPRRHA